jgi:hypothetical protein
MVAIFEIIPDMSPILDRDSIIPERKTKFVRVDETVVFADGKDEGLNHLSLNIKYELAPTILEIGRHLGKSWVDGSRWMSLETDGKIFLEGVSTNCMPRKPFAESREEDAKVIGKITGKEVKY